MNEVIKLLTEKNKTISTMESCTGHYPDSDRWTWLYHLWLRFFPFSSKKNHLAPARFIKRKRKCTEHRRNRPACTIDFTGNIVI